jgi:hypothetical protein
VAEPRATRASVPDNDAGRRKGSRTGQTASNWMTGVLTNGDSVDPTQRNYERPAAG